MTERAEVLRALRSLVNDRLLTLEDAMRFLDHARIPRSAWHDEPNRRE